MVEAMAVGTPVEAGYLGGLVWEAGTLVRVEQVGPETVYVVRFADGVEQMVSRRNIRLVVSA